MSATVAAWAVTYLIHSTLFVAAAFLATRIIRSAAARDVIWRVTLVGALFTASAQIALPTLTRFRVAAPVIVAERTITAPAATLPNETVDVSAPVAASERQADPVASFSPLEQLRGNWPAIVSYLWTILAALLLFRLLVQRRRLFTGFGERREITTPDDLSLLATLRANAGCIRPVRLTRSRAVRSPLAMTSWEICLPDESYSALSEDQKEAILAHELAHVVRHDPMWLHISELLKAIFFFQPLLRYVQKQMRESAEFLCDDFALIQTGKHKALAESLAELATSYGDAKLLPVAGMAEGRSRLLERVSRVLQLGRDPERALTFRSRSAVAACSIALIAIFAPMVTPAVTMEEEDRRPVLQFAAAAGQGDRVIVGSAGAIGTTQAGTRGDSGVITTGGVAKGTQVGGPALGANATTAVGAVRGGSGRDVTVNAQSAGARATQSNAIGAVTGSAGATSVGSSRPAAATVTVQGKKPLEGEFGDVVLEQNDGYAKTLLKAYEIVMEDDATSFSLRKPDGFLIATQTRDDGSKHVVEVRGKDGKVTKSYTVNGVEKGWSEEARKIILDAFTRKSHVGKERQDAQVNVLFWSGNYHYVTDDPRFRLAVHGQGVRLGDAPGEIVEIEPGGELELSEDWKGRLRSVRITGPGRKLHYEFEGDWEGASDEEREAWVRHVFASRKQKTPTPFRY